LLSKLKLDIGLVEEEIWSDDELQTAFSDELSKKYLLTGTKMVLKRSDEYFGPKKEYTFK
jgi:hypothetical protein